MRKKKELDKHHLFLNRNKWWIRFKYPASLGGKRISFPTGTSDLSIAVNIRDRLLNPIIGEVQVADIGRKMIASVKQADDTGAALVALANEELNRTSSTGPTLLEAGSKFLVNRRDFKGRSGHTLDDYLRSIQAFAKVVTDLHVDMVEPRHVREFRDRLLLVGRRWARGPELDLSPAPDHDRLTSRTVVKQIKNLVTFFNWCMKEELVSNNPAAHVDLPITEQNRSKPPPSDAVEALCMMPWPNAPTVGILEWEEMPWFYRYTGARCAEIGQLRIQDVKTIEGILVLDVVTLKTANRRDRSEDKRHRLVPVAEKLKPHVERVLAARAGAGPEEYLFPLAGHRNVRSIAGAPFIRHAWGFSCLYNRHARKITDTHLHCWRSYAISQMARAGIPDEFRRRIVGHATIGVHDGYTHIDLARLKAAVDTIA